MDNNQELEKAAAKYMIDNLHYHDSDGVDVAEVFKAGAQWQDEQDKYWSTAFSFNEKSKIYENRCLEAIEILKRYRESLDGLVWQFENYYGHVLEDVTIKGAKEALDIPIPEWMKERLK